MGGNALKNTETRRYMRDEYLVLEAEVLAQLRKDFPNRRVAAIQAYFEKESFGDMDVLLESDNLTTNLAQYVRETFNSKEVVKNSSVTSFEYKNFQIDLICVTAKNFETSASYFAWNDLGNLMGRVAHKLGFKYGHEGLVMAFRDGDYMYGEVLVSKEIDKIFTFLGYDYDRFLEGFSNLDEIFRFASSTQYFNKEIYSLDNRNHTSRVRDKKRKTYNEFLAWIETASYLPKYPWGEMREHGGPKYKEQFIELAFEMFPGFEAEYRKTKRNYDLWKRAKEVFNGDLVRALTGLEHKELGMFMKHLKEELGEKQPSGNQWLVDLGEAGVENWVKTKFGSYVQPV